MMDTSISRNYPLPDANRSAAIDASRLRDALTGIDADVTAALAPATATEPGRVFALASADDIATGRKMAVPDAAAVKTHVAKAIADLAEISESTLAALAALRDAIGGDPDFAVTILARLEQKADLSLVVDQTVPVGAEMDFTGIVAPPGWLIEDGSLLLRADFPKLTEFALASGNIVSEEEWNAGRLGSYSYGPGGIAGDTLRIPNMRGLFTRALDLGVGRDPGRVIGSLQESQNLRHRHSGRTAASGRHIHSAWTDVQGWHDHWVTGRREGGGFGLTVTAGHQGNPMIWADGQTTSGNGNHGHNVGIGEAPDHFHVFDTDESGGDEARPVNVSRLKILKF